MIVSLDNMYRSELLFLPARNSDGKLVGLEIITNFMGVDDGIRTPTGLVLPRLSEDDEISLFREKLALLETCQLFFIQQQLLAWINISPVIANALLVQNELASLAQRFPFLELTVQENFPALDFVDENHPLALLATSFPLVLANFGAGDASTRAVFSGLFTRIILDKNFIQRQVHAASFDPFMRAIVAQASPYCSAIMAAGVDDAEILQRLQPWGFSAFFGALWPAVDVALLTSLVQSNPA